MKISELTMGVLKNFALIHQSLIVRDPHTIITMSKARNVVALFDAAETFPVNFGIFMLREFLAATALFDLAETDFDFQEKWVRVSCNGNSFRYSYTRIEHIENSERYKPADTYRGFDKFNCFFKLSQADAARLKRASAVMFGSSDYTNVQIHAKEGSGFIKLDYDIDGKDPMSNNFKIEISDVQGECNINFNVENLKLFSGDYDVSVLDGKLLKFAHKEIPLMYFLMPKVG